MTKPEVYWVGTLVVIQWTLTDLDGVPVTDATVTGHITRPDGATAAATVSRTHNLYRAVYEPAIPGTHAWRLEASGTVTDAAAGTFGVRPFPAAGPPPTLDPATDLGKIRALIPDIDPGYLLLPDAQLQVFLDMARGTGAPRLKRAAAAALETIASSETLISKKLRDKDLATDGPAVAKDLRARAAQLRGEADDDEDNAAEDNAGGLAIVDFVDPFHRRWPEATEPEVWY